MDKDKIDWTEEQLEARLVISMYAHRASGYEEASNYAMDRAKLLFAGDKYEQAELAKSISKYLTKEAIRLRETQDENEKEYYKIYKD